MICDSCKPKAPLPFSARSRLASIEVFSTGQNAVDGEGAAAGKQKGEGMEFQFLMIAMALAILFAGGGAFSVDRVLSGGREV